MKLTVKTLKNDKFSVEVEPTTTIAQTKEIVSEARGLAVAGMKLIHSGKILKDTITIAECNIKETDFLVVMGKAKTATPAAAKPAPAPATAEATPAPTTTATPAPPADGAAVPNSAPSNGTPEQIAALTSMGFGEEQAREALRAAFGNQDRAVEYLTNPSTMPGASQSASQPATQSAQPPSQGTGGGSSGNAPRTLPDSSPLAPFLRDPNFTQLRATVQSRPELLPSLLQELGRENPTMVTLFNENREDFFLLLNSPLEAPGGGRPGRGPGGEQMIQVTREENEAIERLCALGFDKNDVVQAYFACDKNEQLAANLLASQGFMD
eukprot:m.51117 g.51117  ORF g.51117 m.51117 type:complete len:324 (+) comp10710_c1_seq1:129-1100(+)